MTKYLVVSDLHFHNWSAFSETTFSGMNSRLVDTLRALNHVAKKGKAEGCERMYVAGDVFHVRGKVAPSVLNPVIEWFSEIINDLGYEVRMIPGNHDLESKDSSPLTNANQALSGIGVQVCNHPNVFEDDHVAMFPWYSDQSELLKQMKRHAREDLTAIIHAPMNNVIKGIPDTGLNPDDFENWATVLSGHYHNHKCLDEDKQIYSIGALTHQTWSDIDSLCGALIVDENSVTRIESSAPKFVELDLAATLEDQKSMCKGNFVRLRLDSASPEEVDQCRELIINDLGAKAAQIDVIPKTTISTRSTSIEAGASIEQSVGDWIELNIEDAMQKQVTAKALEILSKVS